MRGTLRHAVDVLRLDALRHERGRDRRRDRRSRHVEHRDAPQPLEAPRLLLREHVHGVRGHTHDVGRPSLDDPVERADACRRIVGHEMATRDQPLRHAHPGDVMRQGREAEQHRVWSVVPVAHHVARVGEQRVVRVHDALGRAGRARGEGQIHHAVRIGRGCAGIGCRARQVLRRIDRLERCNARKHGVEIGARAVRAPAGLRQQRTRAQSLKQLPDLCTGERAMQRRIAGKALARAGEKHHDRLDAVRHPDRNPVAAHKPFGPEIGSDTVNPPPQFSP